MVDPTAEGELVVRQVRSQIGTKPIHRATLRALGLRRIGATNVLPDRREIHGMLARVSHLVSVERVPIGARSAHRAAKRSQESTS